MFAASADFAIDKPAGQACPHLGSDFRCRIHPRLRQAGFRGCAAFDCFGAGQHVSQVTFGGVDWRRQPRTAQQMFDVFTIMRELHELLWYLAAAMGLQPAPPLADDVRLAFEATERLTHGSPQALSKLDIATHWREIDALLVRVSEQARSRVRPPRPEYRGADLVSADLRRADLSGANFRGACLIRANLRGAKLRLADLTATDLRDAELGGADLSESLFLRQSQLEVANGDGATRLPVSLSRPAHWPTSSRSAR